MRQGKDFELLLRGVGAEQDGIKFFVGARVVSVAENFRLITNLIP